MSSCADFLEIKPQNEIILEDFWAEKADVENIVTGCYSAMQTEDMIKRMIIWGEVRSDNIQSGENINNDGDLYDILKETLTAKNKYTTWDGFYTVINRCNTVLKYAPGVAQIDPSFTDGDLKATIAEVSALRDLCYFYLIRTFKDVPYSEEAFTDDDQKMDLPATPFETVLQNLIADLESIKNDAVNRYPEDKKNYQTGRITKDAIYAMLSEMYLWNKDYDNCIKYAEMVIQSKKDYEEELRNRNGRMSGNASNQATIEQRLNGYPLVNDRIQGTRFGDAYEEIFVEGGSKEIIFELDFDDSPSSSSMLSNAAIGSFYGNQNSRKGLLTASSSFLGDIKEPSGTLIFEAKDKENKNDSRMFINASADDEAIVKYACRSVDIDASDATKVSGTASDRYASDNNGCNWIIYRLPDIMLLEAEALVQQMKEGVDSATLAFNKPKLEKAFRLVNAINKRAICKAVLTDKDTLKAGDFNTKSLMDGLVKRERQRELMFEGKRWYDLVRYSMRAGNTDPVISAVTKRDDVNSQFAQNFFKKMDAIFMPYNYEELKVNHSLIPNPVYGSGENTSYEKTK
jgi:hypothetical protein